jgi:hypothetical protein
MMNRGSKIGKLNLSRYYKIAAVYPVIFSVLCGITLSITHDGSGYKSEWFTNDGFVETVALTIGLSIIIAALSSTIFLNNFSIIKKNGFYSFLSWTIPASLICLSIIYHELENFMTQSEYEGNRILDIYIMLVAVAHLGSMLGTYVLFQRNLRNKHSG